MTSLWLDNATTAAHPSLPPDLRFDVVVVGGGLTGLVAAVLLARGGAQVGLVEARTIGAGATGNTTGKISLLQGTQLSTIAGRHSADKVAKYVEANLEGQQWLLRFCADNGVDVQHESAYTYAQSPDGVEQVRAELEHCRRAGLDAQWEAQPDELPFRTFGAVRLDDQAQFDPVDALNALVEEAQRRGVAIFEHTRVTGVHGDCSVRHHLGERVVQSESGDIRCDAVILATGTPILDRGGYFARLHPNRSYALAFQVPGSIPRGMYLSAESPTRSLRYAPTDSGDALLVGGNGHSVGRAESTKDKVVELIDWTQQHFPGAQLTHSWAAQDYAPADGLPYVGPILPGANRILVATGYNKWGMTNAVAAALALTGRILGGVMPWSRAYEAWTPAEIGGATTAAKLNGEVAVAMAGGWLRAALRNSSAPPAEGAGRVERHGLRPVGVSTVNGTTRAVSAVCPHLYGVLRWNDAECSWDCPLHGSRFTPDGDVLEGPATRPLGQPANPYPNGKDD
ncbi:FAD-dependent oxidoreductase [Skermania sp. ID1734]|uniref:FAD-dependent oxidoreductase n=1 Tax=Skermania sp. ID1734 TaxID=2597516 RepID=UPI00117CAA72|nr:FAD-dependent oxidoreductase [Skermania sp. ID1734]TSD99509.1 FAD-dependent oxidoreductase [Skermania sp. ID1734]